MRGGIFLEVGLVHFLPLSTVNTGAMGCGCVVHVCAHLNLCVCVCVCFHVFSRLRSPGVRHTAEPDVGLPNTTQTQALALSGLGMQCLVILTEVFRGYGGLWKHSLLKLLGPLLALLLHRLHAHGVYLHKNFRMSVSVAGWYVVIS